VTNSAVRDSGLCQQKPARRVDVSKLNSDPSVSAYRPARFSRGFRMVGLSPRCATAFRIVTVLAMTTHRMMADLTVPLDALAR
jgi:hypothetical protein